MTTIPVRLRQIALVATDLQRTTDILTHVLGTEVIYRDPQVGQWGLENALLALGGDVLEIVSPTRSDTTAGRLLQRRGGDGGYMVIMQTVDAAARQALIEGTGLAKVIYSHSTDDALCVQYHPKSVPGGVIPELDSQHAMRDRPETLYERFAPWHACGGDYRAYSDGMRRHAGLQLRNVVCRLAPGDDDVVGAARQWNRVFGVAESAGELHFTNAGLRFVPGVDGREAGLESVTVAVEGEARFHGILERARAAGLCGDGWLNMCGVKWYLVRPDGSDERSRL